MDLFTKVIPAGTILYHGHALQHKIDLNCEHKWFALNKEDAERHGKKTSRYILKHDLSLVNIAHQLFHMDFMYKVISRYPHQEERDKILFPIGLPSLEQQIERIKTNLRPNALLENCEKSKSLKAECEAFKFSVQYNGENWDNYFADAIKKIYTIHQGYICDIHWPSILLGGRLIPEVCIFNPSTVLQPQIIHLGGFKKQSKPRKKDIVDCGRQFIDPISKQVFIVPPGRT